MKVWVNTVKVCWNQLAGTSAVECKNLYLQQMLQWSHFGSSIFVAEVIIFQYIFYYFFINLIYCELLISLNLLINFISKEKSQRKFLLLLAKKV